jgi:hypothetical protein
MYDREREWAREGERGERGERARGRGRRARERGAGWGLLLAVLVGACGDGTGPAAAIPEALVGSWIAEPACVPECGLVVKSVANPQDSVAVTAVLGVTAQINIGRSGTFQLTTIPPIPGGILAGTARVEANELVVRDAQGNEERLSFSVTSTTLTLEFAGELDFDNDGTPEAAVARGVFLKM